MNSVMNGSSITSAGELRFRRSHRRGWIGTSALALFAVMGVWAAHVRAARTPPPAAAAALPVSVSEPLQRDLPMRLEFLGQFSAVERVELRAQVGGTLTQIHFKDGDIVKKGDLLFVIDSVPYDIKLHEALAQRDSARARSELATRELARAEMMKNTDAGSTQNVEQRAAEKQAAQAAVDNADALVRDARFDLDHCRITAPFAGRIGTHLVSTGNLVAGSRAGSSPTISLSDEVSFARQGTLDFVDNALDRASGTIHARAIIHNADLLLTPGGFARVRLAVSGPQATLLVPDETVLEDQSQHIVPVVGADDVVIARKVQVGELRGGLRVIRAGLSPTDKVILEGAPSATPGTKVSPRAGSIQFESDQE
jgi:multidrug efflux pump subunit AcrA (membrane-fusion protein)